LKERERVRERKRERERERERERVSWKSFLMIVPRPSLSLFEKNERKIGPVSYEYVISFSPFPLSHILSL